LQKFFDLVNCRPNISRNNDISQDGQVKVSWLSTTALEAGLTSADMLSQSEVFIKIKFIIFKSGFPKKINCSILFNIGNFIIISIYFLTFICFGPVVYAWPSNCYIIAYVALRKIPSVTSGIHWRLWTDLYTRDSSGTKVMKVMFPVY